VLVLHINGSEWPQTHEEGIVSIRECSHTNSGRWNGSYMHIGGDSYTRVHGHISRGRCDLQGEGKG
jgi:hypothetical protein